MWRPPQIGYVLRGVCGGVDEGHRVGADRYDREGLVIGGKSQPVHKDLAAVERTQIGRLRIA